MEAISVGGNELVQDYVESIKNSVRGKTTRQILLLGPRGIGKSHMLSRIFHSLSKLDQVTAVRLAEEEYSVFSLDDLCRRILEALGCSYHGEDATAYCRGKLSELKENGKPVVLFAENLHMMFGQIQPDLAKLRSIIQSDQSLSIVGSSLTYFDLISSPDEPFYRFFDIRRIRGLAEAQVLELIKKRLVLAKKQSLIGSLEKHAGRMAGVRMLTGGNPRLVHILADTIVQKNSLEDLEQELLSLLDQLTPFYQARMETMSDEQRRLFDTIALAEGPLSPTEIAKRLNTSKLASVVSQLRRMQRDGLVENVKFSNKRGTRYQITERLYRIWRELRSARGADRVKLFVDIIKLWYTQEDLAEELEGVSSEFDKLYPHSEKETASAAKKMCYVLRTVRDIEIVQLYAAATRLARSNQSEYALQEIQRMRDLNGKEKNEILQKCGDVLISFAELELLTDSTSPVYAGKIESIMDRIDGLDERKVSIPKAARDRKIIHTTYEAIASYLISHGRHERALYFNDIAHDCSKGVFCAIALNQRAGLKAFQGYHDESLRLVNKILKQEPENREALARKVLNLTDLNRQDLAVEASKELLALGVGFFVVASMPFIRFRLEQELLALTKQYRESLLKLESGGLSSILRSYIEILTHELWHAIIDKKADDRRFAISALSSIKDMAKPEDVAWGCAHAVFANIRGVDGSQEMIPTLSTIFGRDKLEGLTPLTKTLQYFEDKDPAVLEKMHPELRHLAIHIIQKVSPDITISKEILDSVSSE